MENENSYEFKNAKLTIKNLPVIPASASCNLIYFDLETSGFYDNDQILQIAAKFGRSSFEIYVNPTQAIDPRVTEVTGLENINGDLYHNGERVNSVPIKHALMEFMTFLESFRKPYILVAHNVSFDSRFLMRAIIHNFIINYFTMIVGFSDTYFLLKRRYPERTGQGMFKLARLAEDFLKIPPNNYYHRAPYDVEVLEKLVMVCSLEQDLIANCQRYKNAAILSLLMPVLRPMENCVSRPILKKLALAGLNPGSLCKIYTAGGPEAIHDALAQSGSDNAAIVTKDKVVIEKIIAFIRWYMQ